MEFDWSAKKWLESQNTLHKQLKFWQLTTISHIQHQFLVQFDRISSKRQSNTLILRPF